MQPRHKAGSGQPHQSPPRPRQPSSRQMRFPGAICPFSPGRPDPVRRWQTQRLPKMGEPRASGVQLPWPSTTKRHGRSRGCLLRPGLFVNQRSLEPISVSRRLSASASTGCVRIPAAQVRFATTNLSLCRRDAVRDDAPGTEGR
jgi:hypothetical protein